MANFAVARTNASQGVAFDWNAATGAYAIPAVQYPATGGVSHIAIDKDVYVPVVAKPNNASGAGFTTGTPVEL